jgi:hypothetical protein
MSSRAVFLLARHLDHIVYGFGWSAPAHIDAGDDLPRVLPLPSAGAAPSLLSPTPSPDSSCHTEGI